MISEEVRIKKLCVKASRAILEDTVRSPLPFPLFWSRFYSERLPLVFPSWLHTKPSSRVTSPPFPEKRPSQPLLTLLITPSYLPAFVSWSVAGEIRGYNFPPISRICCSPTFSHFPPFSSLPLPPTKPRRFSPMAPGVMRGVRGGAEVGDGALGEKSPSSVSGSCMGRAVGHFHLQITITVENEGKRGGG